MSYGLIEARVQVLMQGLTAQFPDADLVTRGDWRVLDRGVDQCAVLNAGAIAEGDSYSAGACERTWTVLLDIVRRYGSSDNGAASVAFQHLRDAVLEHVQAYPTLNGLAGVQAVGQIQSQGDPYDIYDKSGNGPFFKAQTFVIPVTELAVVTILEA